MIIQRHWVTYQLKALVNGTVVLAVKMFGLAINNTQNAFGIALIFTGLVNFQLHTKVLAACTIKNRLRLVIIIIDKLILAFIIAIIAIVITVLIIGVILLNNCIAINTASIMLIIAILTDRPIAAAYVILAPDTFTVADTGCGLFLPAIFT